MTVPGNPSASSRSIWTYSPVLVPPCCRNCGLVIVSGCLPALTQPCRAYPDSEGSVAVLLLTGFDANSQPVLRRRQRAGGVGGEGAGRVVGFVEVEHHLAVFGQRGIQEAAGAIGFPGGGLVAEDEEELLRARLFENRVESEFLAVEAEYRVAGTFGIFRLPQHVQDGDLVRFGHPLCGDAPGRVDWKRFDTLELAPRGGFRVLQPDAELVAALDHQQAETSDTERIRGIVPQLAGRAVHRDGDFAVVQMQDAGVRGAVGEHDVARCLFAERVGACMQPK